MKVLMLTGYFYDEHHKEFSRNRTGFGLLVTEIMTSVGAKETVVTDTYRITDGYELKSELGSCRVRCHSAWMIMKHLRFRDIIKAICSFFDSKQNIKDRIHIVFYHLSAGVFRNTIREEKPDIVHIHNINPVFIDACEAMKMPYVVTQHGLDGLREDVGQFYFEEEKEFFRLAQRNGVPVTVISTGIKKRIEKYYLNGEKADNIYVVMNGTNLSRAQSISEGKQREKHITVIGSICQRKNQEQIIEAINLLGDKLNGYTVCICGVDGLNGVLQEKVNAYGLQDKVRFLGFVEPKEIDDLLEQAELNILASMDEGFGLSMIEGFAHGVPTVTFADLDAVPDIYDNKAMVLCYHRSNEALADAIAKALDTDWDRDYIRKHSLNFSLEKMTEKYIEVYKKVLSQSKEKSIN